MLPPRKILNFTLCVRASGEQLFVELSFGINQQTIDKHINPFLMAGVVVAVSSIFRAGIQSADSRSRIPSRTGSFGRIVRVSPLNAPLQPSQLTFITRNKNKVVANENKL